MNKNQIFKHPNFPLTLQKEKIRKKIKLSKQDEKDIRFMRIISEWIDDRKYMMMKKFSYLFSLLEEMFDRLSVSYEEGAFLTQAEILDIFIGKIKFSPAIIQKRKKNFAIIYQTNQPQSIVYGQQAEKMFEAAKKFSKVGGLKGAVASRGAKDRVTGKAVIVHDPCKDKFNQGEILVTSMTRIEFVPLMRKAKAIITNEGGIASHAAVVSREMNVPCIIGTREATDKLKSGDKVEMNMKTGAIKIIL